jgi:PPOX class probable F420-dependent enzyme
MDADLALAATARVARLATLDADGRPHLVPIVFAVAGGTLYTAVDDKPKRGDRELRRLRNARERPAATILVDHYAEDWQVLWWVRIDGSARVLDGGEEADTALALLAAKYEQYARTPPRLPVLAVDVDRTTAWRATR